MRDLFVFELVFWCFGSYVYLFEVCFWLLLGVKVGLFFVWAWFGVLRFVVCVFE